jgi:PHD/YefM family antitoxin component YafN of YafNO toxin-antitoxin module
MKSINVLQIEEQIDEALKIVLTEPVAIMQQQKDIAVLLSSERYQELLGFEDKYLHDLAMAAEQEGFIGIEASRSLLDSI